MSKPEDIITMAVRVLNEAVKADRMAIVNLIDHRVPCNEELAEHPSIQVSCKRPGEKGGVIGCKVGMLGIINGIFGVDEQDWGFIAAEMDAEGRVVRFIDRRFEPGNRESNI
jgi:hypothetical protein